MKKITKAVIPAAGLGTRFLPATKAMPKEMLPIIDIPTIQYIVEEAVQSGITDLLIITSRSKKAIEDHFDINVELECALTKSGKTQVISELRKISDMVNVQFIRQQEQKGLGHAVYHAKTFAAGEPFAVLLGDDVVHSEVPCLKQMIDVYEKHPGTILGVQTVSYDNISKYGALDCSKVEDRVYRVKDMVEKPKKEEAPSNIAVLGRYILEPEIFDALEKTKPGAGGEIQLTDAIKMLCESGKVYGYDFIGRRYDVGDKFGYLQAMVEYALRRDDLGDVFSEYLKEIIASL